MKKLLASALGLLLVAAVLSGCGKSSKPASPLGSNGGNNGSTAVDVARVNDQVATNPGVVDENVYETSSPTGMDASSSTFAAIRPLRWWRTVETSERNVDTQFSDPDSLGRPRAALVTITRHLVGQLHIAFGDTTATDTSIKVITKPIDELWTRKLALHRFRFEARDSSDDDDHDERADDDRDGWRIVGVSGVRVVSKAATTHIASIRIQSGSRDTTITDPLALARVRHVCWLAAMQPVTVTVTTGRNDDIVFLYRFMNRHRLKNNGDGTYSITFTDVDFGGLHHFGVNAFSKGTLYDDTAPYDSDAWLLPFAARLLDAEIGHH